MYFLIFMVLYAFFVLVAIGAGMMGGATTGGGVVLVLAGLLMQYWVDSKEEDIWDFRFEDLPALRSSIVWEIGAAILLVPSIIFALVVGMEQTDSPLLWAGFASAPILILLAVLGLARLAAQLESFLGLPESQQIPSNLSELAILIRYTAEVRSQRGASWRPPGRKRRYYSITAFWTAVLTLFTVVMLLE